MTFKDIFCFNNWILFKELSLSLLRVYLFYFSYIENTRLLWYIWRSNKRIELVKIGSFETHYRLFSFLFLSSSVLLFTHRLSTHIHTCLMCYYTPKSMLKAINDIRTIRTKMSNIHQINIWTNWIPVCFSHTELDVIKVISGDSNFITIQINSFPSFALFSW